MRPTEMNMTNMQWRAPLLRLTSIGNPDVANGEPSPVFVQPEAITMIRVVRSGYAVAGSLLGKMEDRRFHEQVECTEVNCCHFMLLVTESPATVAMMRDQAFGFEPSPQVPAKVGRIGTVPHE
jgi:hypothetical protein